MGLAALGLTTMFVGDGAAMAALETATAALSTLNRCRTFGCAARFAHSGAFAQPAETEFRAAFRSFAIVGADPAHVVRERAVALLLAHRRRLARLGAGDALAIASDAQALLGALGRRLAPGRGRDAFSVARCAEALLATDLARRTIVARGDAAVRRSEHHAASAGRLAGWVTPAVAVVGYAAPALQQAATVALAFERTLAVRGAVGLTLGRRPRAEPVLLADLQVAARHHRALARGKPDEQHRQRQQQGRGVAMQEICDA